MSSQTGMRVDESWQSRDIGYKSLYLMLSQYNHDVFQWSENIVKTLCILLFLQCEA